VCGEDHAREAASSRAAVAASSTPDLEIFWRLPDEMWYGGGNAIAGVSMDHVYNELRRRGIAL